jgi:hypothetical protein
MPAHGYGDGGSTTDAVTGLIDAHRLGLTIWLTRRGQGGRMPVKRGCR